MDVITYAAAVKKAQKMIEEQMEHLPIADEDTLGVIMVGDGLDVTNAGVLSVDCAEAITEGDTRPITADAVYKEIGNVCALLAQI